MKMCEECGKNKATIYEKCLITGIESHLCDECFKQ